jgi:hypothetical protein
MELEKTQKVKQFLTWSCVELRPMEWRARTFKKAHVRVRLKEWKIPARVMHWHWTLTPGGEPVGQFQTPHAAFKARIEKQSLDFKNWPAPDRAFIQEAIGLEMFTKIMEN